MCSIGEFSGGDCHSELIAITEFTPEQVKLLKLRAGTKRIKSVCKNHELKLLHFYEKRHIHCCNPLSRHSTGPGKGVVTINLSLYRKAKGIFELIPGKKLCKPCSTLILQVVGGRDEDVTPESSQRASQPNVLAVEDEVPLQPVAVPNQADQEAAGGILPRLRTRLIQQPIEGDAQEGKRSHGSSQDSDPKVPSVHSAGFVPPPRTEAMFTEPPCNFDLLNNALIAMGASPIERTKLVYQVNYGREKLNEIKFFIKDLLMATAPTSIPSLSRVPHDDCVEVVEDYNSMINQLKEKFRFMSKTSEKVVLLSVLPPTWSIPKTLSEFGDLGASKFIIKKTKELVQAKGPLVSPNPKKGKSLPQETVQKVIEFYELDEISSKQMPGCKDYVTVKIDNVKQQVQKRLLLNDLSVLHSEYLKMHGESHSVSFSKFAELRPKHCVLAGSAGTHSVCVCIYHENVNLMIEGVGLKKLSNGTLYLLIYSYFLYIFFE